MEEKRNRNTQPEISTEAAPLFDLAFPDLPLEQPSHVAFHSLYRCSAVIPVSLKKYQTERRARRPEQRHKVKQIYLSIREPLVNLLLVITNSLAAAIIIGITCQPPSPANLKQSAHAVSR
jgi:hypothetical protein